MTITSILDTEKRASQEGWCVPLFNVFDAYGVDGVFEAMEDKRAPTILGYYSGSFEQSNAGALCAYIQARLKHSSVPASLMLDHGASFEQCVKALRYGFTDVMFDGSQLPLDDNIRTTRLVVQAAHAVGVSVEAELGHVGLGKEYEVYGGKRQGFTDPDLVERFIEETGVDSLAIAFGNAHGVYNGEPRLDLDLLRTVRQQVGIPIVMHGGTGLVDDQYRQVVAAGVAKINLATVILQEASRRMVVESRDEKASMFSIAGHIKGAYREICSHFYDVLGTTGKA